MTQPGDQSRVTRRVPQQSVWDGVEIEISTDDIIACAIGNIETVVEYLFSQQGQALPPQEERERFWEMAQTGVQQLRDVVACRDRDRRQLSLQSAERFNESRRQYGERIEQLQADLEKCREWIEIHDPMLVENERVIAELELANAALAAKHQQAQDEILRQADDIQQLMTDAARLRMGVVDEAHRAEVERFRKENEALRAELGKTRAERDKAQGDLSVAKAAESKAVEAKITSTREFDAFKRQVGSKIVQPILVIATSEQVAKGKGKTEDDWVKLFPKANFARFMIKVLEASINMAKGKATSYQLIDAVKMARAADIDPFYQIDPNTPSGEVLDLALNECHVWFTQLMLAFKEKVEQSARLSAELTEADRVVKEAVEGIATLRATLKKKE